MTAIWLSVGAAIVDGVLTEPPVWTRLPIDGVITDGVLTLAAGITFGPFAAAIGPLAAFALLNAEEEGATLYTGAMPSLTVPPGAYLTFPAGSYAVSAAAGAGSDVITIGGQVLKLGGDPLRTG